MNSNKDWTKFWKFVAAIALALSTLAVTLSGIGVLAPSEEAIARSTYQCAVHTEQGCAKFVVEDGGEIEVQSGGTMDVQSGAATTFGGDVTIAGTCTGCSINQASNIAITGTLEVTGATSLNSTLDVDGATTLNSTLDVDGNISSGTGAITATDNILVDGAADVVQLTVQGYTTQTSNLLLLEQSGGTDKLTVSNDGNTDIAGTLQYGVDDLYALGHASSGQQVVYGTSAVTGTETVAHGLSTVTFCIAVLGEDPKTGANEAAFVTVAVAGNACTVKVWQDDWTSAATETSVVVQWLVIGAP